MNKEEIITLCYEAECDRLKQELNEQKDELQKRIDSINYKKEYENMSLCDFADELVEPLCTIKKDLTKTIYIHYAEERDKNYKLEEENKKYKEVIDKAIKFIEDTYYSKNTTDIDSIVLSSDKLIKVKEILKEEE